MNFAEGFPHTAPPVTRGPSRLNFSLLLGCFQRVSVPAEMWHNKGMLLLSTATVVLHQPGKTGETWTPLERELVFHSNVFNRRLCFKWVGTSEPEQPDAVKRRPRL